ncbi:MAG: LysR family transcriptional regulator [Deltaproteobacteria bacterium]|nr:LysR family transcriptional regulator [Deltaproteobacteria bacterium]
MSRTLLAHAEKLHALRVLVRARSFRRAAAVLGVTPPALSQSMAALEKHLGRSLVERSSRGASPTPFAQRLLAETTAALDVLLAADGREQTVLPPMRLRLGAYESLAVSALPDLIGQLAANHPDVRISIRTGRSSALARMVQRGELDVALVAETDAAERLDTRVVATDRLGLWASTGGAAAAPNGVARPNAFAGLANDREGLPSFYRRFVRAAGLSSTPYIACDSFEALRVMALRRIAPAVLPDRVALRVPDQLRRVDVPSRALEAGAHSVWLVTRQLARADIREVLASELRTILAAR